MKTCPTLWGFDGGKSKSASPRPYPASGPKKLCEKERKIQDLLVIGARQLTSMLPKSSTIKLAFASATTFPVSIRVALEDN